MATICNICWDNVAMPRNQGRCEDCRPSRDIAAMVAAAVAAETAAEMLRADR